MRFSFEEQPATISVQIARANIKAPWYVTNPTLPSIEINEEQNEVWECVIYFGIKILFQHLSG